MRGKLILESFRKVAFFLSLFFLLLFLSHDNDSEQTMANDSRPVQGSLMHVQD